MSTRPTTFSTRSSAFPSKATLAITATLATLAASPTAHATNLIKRPGSHPKYTFEIEPHLSFYYGYWSHRDSRTDAGPGVRFSIPFIDNGPISKLNNNLGISFGLDTYFPYDGVVAHIPVVAQWNFFFTEIISVIAEAGASLNFGNIPNAEVDPEFHGGGRFQFGVVSVIVRVGYPDTTVGAGFQF